MIYHINFIWPTYCGAGNIAVDIPVSRLPEGAVCRGLALPRTTQVYEFLCASLWLHAAAQHAVQSRLRFVQDSNIAR